MNSSNSSGVGHDRGYGVLAAGDPEAVSRAAAALRAGEVIAIPTDTVYGLAASLDFPAAIDQLYAIKGRPPDKPIPILLGSFADLQRVATDISAPAMALARHFWPGALTLIVPARGSFPAVLTSTGDDGVKRIAVRIPNHSLTRSILSASGGSLAVTSANRSGQPPALDAISVVEMALGSLGIIIDGGSSRVRQPSTVILALTSQTLVLREGAISSEAIHEYLATVRHPAAHVEPSVHSTV